MKGIVNISALLGIHFTLLLSLVFVSGQAQQNATLFFMHSLPEANFVNPAVQGKCGVFIGLPVISSFHMNIANSGFTGGDILTVYTNNTFDRKTNFNTGKIKGLNYFQSELITTILAVGLQKEDYYYTFTIMEKDNATALYTRGMVAFILRGAPEFEGQSVRMNGTNIAFNHYREYAFGISKVYSNRLTLGLKAKLLFGKYNFTTRRSTFEMHVEENTNNIVFDVDGGFNSSLPSSLRMENPGTYRFYKRYDAPFGKQLLNARNPGIAFDFGFIFKYSDRMIFSGSLLDMGLIYYRSNLTNYTLSGQYTYNGPFGAGQVTDRYLWDVFDALNQNMSNSLTHHPYVYFLDPKLYLGAAYQLNKRFDLNMLVFNRLLPGKLQTGATVSLLTRPSEKLEASLSWSYMHRSLTNLGIGVGYGISPLQLYLVSDNIFAFILPMSVKDVNIRLGINLNLGCKERFNIDQCGCSWLKDAESHRLRVKGTRRNKRG